MNCLAHPEETVVDAALEMPAQALGAYLDKVCGGDMKFRQLVEALLRAHEEASLRIIRDRDLEWISFKWEAAQELRSGDTGATSSRFPEAQNDATKCA